MKTYKTYAEAKLAYPNCDIMTTGEEWEGGESISDRFMPFVPGMLCGKTGWVKANPADHLMSLEEFFAAGGILKEGDETVDDGGNINTFITLDNINGQSSADGDTFILSAAFFGGGSHPVDNEERSFADRLAEKSIKQCRENMDGDKKKTRTRYLLDIRTTNEIAKAMVNGEVLYNEDGTLTYKWKADKGTFVEIQNDGCEYIASIKGSFFQKTEIDPVEEVAEWFWKNRPNKLSTQEWDLVCSANRETFMWIAKTALENGFKLPDTN